MYQLFGKTPFGDVGIVLRLSDNAQIPMVDSNRDYQEYKQWLAEGNTPAPLVDQALEK